MSAPTLRRYVFPVGKFIVESVEKSNIGFVLFVAAVPGETDDGAKRNLKHVEHPYTIEKDADNPITQGEGTHPCSHLPETVSPFCRLALQLPAVKLVTQRDKFCIGPGCQVHQN